ncbi:methyltransferase domain-containing protein [Catenuloplanes atrovinosus]|uniref:RNA methylase n=1 Tax=Catenuloplanes atrovinosus TaxID=137266 RepID=A0AAE4CAT9_9ACTN|nr:methyltransferase domain-containing protein [Catenuloplanes atrovinosus]MDR7274935.1 putative RNA methylase [Catenuloplanes atrovinosus]
MVHHKGSPADVIPLQYHAQMLLDDRRMGAFQAAIGRVVRPGSRVLELGAGTGVLAHFAAVAGAASVIAVEREPSVYQAASRSLAAHGDDVVVVHADARSFTPPPVVDVVICEMLHVGLLRERQVEVIGAFLSSYAGPPPAFLPCATIQAVQPVAQDFTFYGYTVAAPLFQDPSAAQPRTTPLAPPSIFQSFFYGAGALPAECAADARFVVQRDGELNAVRMITKNLLTEEPAPVEWLMNYLVVPLPAPMRVTAGDTVRIRFAYRPGDEIPELMASLYAEVLSPARSG